MKQKSKLKKNSSNLELESKFEINYNSGTYSLGNPNTKLVFKKIGNKYKTESLTKTNLITLTYKDICINTNNIFHIYVILQYIYDKKTLIKLYKYIYYKWNYRKFNIQITSDQELPIWAKILNQEFSTIIKPEKIIILSIILSICVLILLS
tara:strand:+ start:4407 stop:4859 length:453 start_codon:yes stop_codon:yes gene_type:complete